jgi:hypothetical protein
MSNIPFQFLFQISRDAIVIEQRIVHVKQKDCSLLHRNVFLVS